VRRFAILLLLPSLPSLPFLLLNAACYDVTSGTSSRKASSPSAACLSDRAASSERT
jgi:hypothetical protein